MSFILCIFIVYILSFDHVTICTTYLSWKTPRSTLKMRYLFDSQFSSLWEQYGVWNGSAVVVGDGNAVCSHICSHEAEIWARGEARMQFQSPTSISLCLTAVPCAQRLLSFPQMHHLAGVQAFKTWVLGGHFKYKTIHTKLNKNIWLFLKSQIKYPLFFFLPSVFLQPVCSLPFLPVLGVSLALSSTFRIFKRSSVWHISTCKYCQCL